MTDLSFFISKIETALSRRKSFVQNSEYTTAWRMVNGDGDGIDNITVDRLGDVILVESHGRDTEAELVIKALAVLFPKTAIFLKNRWSPDLKQKRGTQISGPPAANLIKIVENGLKFKLNLTDEEHIGLFLDSRPARKFVLNNSRDRRVLNLFSYTAGFGVAAAAGNALSTVNIDNKNSALRIGKDNYVKNSLSFDTRTFFKCDVLEYLKRASKQTGRFDFIIIDPPPKFKRKGKTDFLSHIHYDKLLNSCLTLAGDSDSIIMAGLNSLKAGDSQFETLINSAGAAVGKSLQIIDTIGPGCDFPASKTRPVARFKILKIL